MCYVLSTELMSIFLSVFYLDDLVLNFFTAFQNQERHGEDEFTVESNGETQNNCGQLY